MRELVTQRPRGFGFITFATQKDMEWAIDEMHNTRISGRVVTVSRARPFERPRGDRSPRRFDSPERRASYHRRDRDGMPSQDFPRRYQSFGDRDNGQRPYYDSRHRSYDQPIQSRRYGRDGRGVDDQRMSNEGYPTGHYDSRSLVFRVSRKF